MISGSRTSFLPVEVLAVAILFTAGPQRSVLVGEPKKWIAPLLLRLVSKRWKSAYGHYVQAEVLPRDLGLPYGCQEVMVPMSFRSLTVDPSVYGPLERVWYPKVHLRLALVLLHLNDGFTEDARDSLTALIVPPDTPFHRATMERIGDLHSLRVLTFLALDGSVRSDEIARGQEPGSALRCLLHISRLETLHFELCSGVLRSEMPALPDFRERLQHLSLRSAAIIDPDLRHLRELRLTSLELDFGAADGSGFSTWLEVGGAVPPIALSLKVLVLLRCRLMKDQTLEHLSLIDNLLHLTLRECLSLSGATLIRLARLSRLELLDLGGNGSIQKSKMAELAKLPNLTSLDLSHWSAPMDLGFLSNAAHLRQLKVISFRKLSNECLRSLAQASQLQELTLDCSSGWSSLDELSRSRASFAKLSLSATSAPGPVMVALATQNLRVLCALGANLSDADLSHIAKRSPNLCKLNVADTSTSDTGLSALAGLTCLEVLDCSRCTKISGSGFSCLLQLPALRVLRLRGCSGLGTDALLNHFRHALSVEDLVLACCPCVSPRSAEVLAALPRLRLLDLGSTNLDDAGLARLAHAPVLEVLSVSWCKRVSLEGLKALRTCNSLRDVDCSFTEVPEPLQGEWRHLRSLLSR